MSDASIIPTMRYRDAASAIEWLCEAFGFHQHLVVPGPNGTIAHAQLTFGNASGNGMIMLGSARDDEFGSMQKPPATTNATVTQSAYIIVDDADVHCKQARAAGAEIVYDVADQDYGGRLYMCRDLEGHLWSFGTYNPWLD